MKHILRIPQYIWTFYCFLFFFLFTVFVTLPFLFIFGTIGSKKTLRWMHSVPPYTAKVVLFFWGTWLKKIYKYKPNKDESYVFVSNHRSYLDPMIVSRTMPHYTKYLGKKELEKMPVVGYSFKHMNIAVDRSSKEGRKQSFIDMIEAVKSGASMFLAPEGTCHYEDLPLREFKDGAFKLAVATQRPIVPMAIINSSNLLNRKTFLVKPGLAKCVMLPEITTAGLTNDDIPALKLQVRAAIEDEIKSHK